MEIMSENVIEASEDLARLGSHPNIYSSCIELLSKEGWIITTKENRYEENDLEIIDCFVAKKDNTIIIADTPIELLGLASLHTYHFPHNTDSYWWRINNGGHLLGKLEDEALERSFFEFKERNIVAWKKSVKKALKDYKYDENKHEILGISEKNYIDLVKEYPEFK